MTVEELVALNPGAVLIIRGYSPLFYLITTNKAHDLVQTHYFSLSVAWVRKLTGEIIYRVHMSFKTGSKHVSLESEDFPINKIYYIGQALVWNVVLGEEMEMKMKALNI